jgi:asparagine synthetase B (glutamine-hydrolysing)
MDRPDREEYHMCGIAGIYLRDPEFRVDALDSMLDTMLDEIQHRGGDATGFVALGNEGVLEWHRAACDVSDFVKYRRPVPKGTRTILAHTRYATQGLPAFIENNHPIKRGPFYVIHNGHVSNDQQLFKLADRKPFGQVDSEAIPARLASLGKLTDAEVVMEEIEGAAAIAAVDESNPRELVLAKGHSSPLFVLVTNKIVVWGSTRDTVEVAYKKHVGRLPKKRKIESLESGTMLHFSAEGKQTRTKFECYVPAYKTYTPSAWKETTGFTYSTEGAACSVPSVPPTRHLPTIGGYPEWDSEEEEGTSAKADDALRCDICDRETSLSVASYEMDEDGSTWILCPRCMEDISEDYTEEFERVNAAILADSEDDQ